MVVCTEEDISSLMRFLYVQAMLKHNHALVEKTKPVVREGAGSFTQSSDEHTM